MDFPLQLISSSNLEFVYGLDELRNDLYLLLKEVKGSFLQSVSLGTSAVPHVSSELYLESTVRRVCEQLDGVSADYVGMEGEFIVIRIRYKGQVAQFNFSVTSF